MIKSIIKNGNSLINSKQQKVDLKYINKIQINLLHNDITLVTFNNFMCSLARPLGTTLTLVFIPFSYSEVV